MLYLHPAKTLTPQFTVGGVAMPIAPVMRD
jgi:hypothetical protein